MASVKGMKVFHCPECGYEIFVCKGDMPTDYLPTCYMHDKRTVEMIKGAAPKAASKMLNPIKNSKRNR